MSEPIKKKINQLASAPTPQNTPASLTGSYLKNNPLMVPTTIDEEAEIKKNLSNNPAFLSMIQGKLGTLIGKDSGYVDALSPKVKNRIYSLKAIQKQQMDLEPEFQRELLELEKKYAAKYQPIYNHRRDIINGVVEPTEEEIETGKQIEKELGAYEDEEEDAPKLEEIKEEEDEGEGETKEEEKGIPNFWLTAFENLSFLSQTITDRDQEVLAFLKDVRLEYLSQPGFRLVFEFNENPFFKNQKLLKTYYYQTELGYSGDYIYDHAEGDVIEWTSAKQNVTVTIERRRQRNKQTQQTRTIEKATPVESFFNFFDPPKAPADDEEGAEEDEEDLEETEELEARLKLDYQLGEELKDQLIPRAIDWFTGAAVDYEGELEDEFDEFDEEDDDDEDDDEDEDEDDDEDDADGGAKGKQPPECKQT